VNGGILPRGKLFGMGLLLAGRWDYRRGTI
jgi:hypothetical protein